MLGLPGFPLLTSEDARFARILLLALAVTVAVAAGTSGRRPGYGGGRYTPGYTRASRPICQGNSCNYNKCKYIWITITVRTP